MGGNQAPAAGSRTGHRVTASPNTAELTPTKEPPMIELPLLDSHDPLLRVESLHAFAYCPRLFYFQEVERISVPHENVFAGRQLHAALEADEDGQAVNLELTSTTLGITRKAACLRHRDGPHLPDQHKRAHPRRPGTPGADTPGSPKAWPSGR